MKKIISSIIIFILVLLAGTAISKSDSIKYSNTMNRLGMSEDATVLETNSKKNLVTAIKDLNKKKLTSYQITFFDKNNSDIGYIYNYKRNDKLPIISGRYFSKSDFSSQIPFAVQGKSSEIEDYKPQSQSYIKIGQRYISVIGTMGFGNSDLLNNQTLISLSPKQPKVKKSLKNVITVLDGKAVTSKESYSRIKKTLHVRSAHKYSPQTDDFSAVKVENNGELYKVGIVLLFIMAIAVEFYILIPLKYDLQRSNLTGDLKNNYRNGLLIRYLLYTLIPYLIGYLIVNWKIVIISHTTFNMFMIGSLGLAIIVGLHQIFFVKRTE
ncbi:hypothetical protein [Companilactobacillus keshanensis]|uniref:MacB-like periplasmic core domain-containing protein n=1 Tax=Companilactobacillus keshanensis TaxID=2486003 RepID=A0ABW4BWZ0_9LACO|nr:hypothetical protein [Companilactobacillus keshanensis]